MSGAGDHERIVADLAERLADVDALGPAAREVVYGVLDAVDELHGQALRRLGEVLDEPTLVRLRAADPGIAWLFDAYAVGIDHDGFAAALEDVRAHAGDVELEGLRDGVVRLRVRDFVGDHARLRAAAERAVAPHVPGFVAVELSTAPGAPPLPDDARLLPLAPQRP